MPQCKYCDKVMGAGMLKRHEKIHEVMRKKAPSEEQLAAQVAKRAKILAELKVKEAEEAVEAAKRAEDEARVAEFSKMITEKADAERFRLKVAARGEMSSSDTETSSEGSGSDFEYELDRFEKQLAEEDEDGVAQISKGLHNTRISSKVFDKPIRGKRARHVSQAQMINGKWEYVDVTDEEDFIGNTPINQKRHVNMSPNVAATLTAHRAIREREEYSSDEEEERRHGVHPMFQLRQYSTPPPGTSVKTIRHG